MGIQTMRRSFMTAAAILLCLILSISWEQVSCAKRKKRVRDPNKVWVSVLGGPSYTPEASLGVGGAMLMSFKMDKKDTVSQRSFLPVGFNLSLNGTVVVAGAGTFFFNRDKYRLYMNYSFRNEPANYYGTDMSVIENTPRGSSTTGFHKMMLQFNPRFVWQARPGLFAGALVDVNYTKSTDLNPVMLADPYISKFRTSYLNTGLGAMLQYDTRDDVATPSRGFLVSGTGKFYSRAFGGAYNYQILELEYRHFLPLFHRRSVLGWTAKTQIGFNDIPFTELPMFGSPFDLRGYYWGKYRDKSMMYGIAEYRHMFGSNEAYERGTFWSKLGFVVWGGIGTIGDTPLDWKKWKLNYGVGIRIQIQKNKNFRMDFGKEPGVKGILFYMNMTEAF